MRHTILVMIMVLMPMLTSAQQDEPVTIMSDGRSRSFIVHTPSNPNGAPVVFAFHGTNGTAPGMQATGLSALADLHGFIVVYPQALSIGGVVQWNVYVDAKPGHGGVNVDDAPDDVVFVRDMISWLRDRYAVPQQRIYATGLSNGGFMCYALSILASNEIAAIAPVAANMWGDNDYLAGLPTYSSVRPIPVMHVHGTADQVVAYPDPDDKPMDYQEYPLFVAGRACGALTYSTVENIAPNVDRLVFCGQPIRVELIRIRGMGHAWSNGAFETSREIIRFFDLLRTTSVNHQPQTTNHQLLTTNHTLDLSIDHDGRLRVVDLLGRVLVDQAVHAGPLHLDLSAYGAGPYLLMWY